MASLIHPPSGVFREKTRDAVIDAPDGISGLVQALNEVLYLLDTEGFLLSHATAACTGDPGPGGPGGAGPSPSPAPIRLTLKLEGDAVDAPGRTYKVAGGVKAATYGDSTLLFLRGEGLWQATITLDI
jgi:SHS2 domain-containing protein